jgi:hypothetical protein
VARRALGSCLGWMYRLNVLVHGRFVPSSPVGDDLLSLMARSARILCQVRGAHAERDSEGSPADLSREVDRPLRRAKRDVEGGAARAGTPLYEFDRNGDQSRENRVLGPEACGGFVPKRRRLAVTPPGGSADRESGREPLRAR